MLLAACRQPTPKAATEHKAVTTLAVLPAESDRFPQVAEAITASLTNAAVTGIDRTEVSKVSLEVVQLSIECVEPTADCYEAVGKSLAANRLLFALLEPDGKRRVRVTVTLFDVDSRAPKTAKKVFASEQDASAGVADLVAEATR
jgi:hypothetical protein